MTNQERKISPDLEQRAKENPQETFHTLVSIINPEDLDKTEENQKKLQAYLNENQTNQTAGYSSPLDLTGQQILYLKDQDYITIISVPHPKALMPCE